MISASKIENNIYNSNDESGFVILGWHFETGEDKTKTILLFPGLCGAFFQEQEKGFLPMYFSYSLLSSS